jgi:hypothetical protein
VDGVLQFTRSECIAITDFPATFLDGSVRSVGGLLHVPSPLLFSQLQDALGGQASYDDVVAKIMETLKVQGHLNDVDVAILTPATPLANARTAFWNGGPMFDHGGPMFDLGVVFFPMFSGGIMGPLLHEVGHAWGVKLPESILPGSLSTLHPHGHWGLTSLDQYGQLGGYPHAAVKCESPAFLSPSPGSPCDTNVLIWDLGSGDTRTNNDANWMAGYARVELIAMGLLPPSEFDESRDYLVFCADEETDWLSGSSLTARFECQGGIHMSTAAEMHAALVAQPDHAIRMQPNGPHRKNIRTVAIVLHPDQSSIPDAVSSMNEDTLWWSEYVGNFAGVHFSHATGARATTELMGAFGETVDISLLKEELLSNAQNKQNAAQTTPTASSLDCLGSWGAWGACSTRPEDCGTRRRWFSVSAAGESGTPYSPCPTDSPHGPRRPGAVKRP